MLLDEKGKQMKTILADDVDLTKLKYPVYVSVKMDGVRCIAHDNKAKGRSLIEFPNTALQELFNHSELSGLDGELIDGPINADDACRRTTSVASSFDKTIEHITYNVFDIFNHPDKSLPFKDRILIIKQKYNTIKEKFPFIKLVEHILINNEEELLKFEDKALADGYEGIIIRSLDGIYKYGRSTVREQFFLRLKRFSDSEMKITGFKQELKNNNKLEKDLNGYAKRSSSKENLVAKERVGVITGIDIHTGKDVNIGTGFDDKLAEDMFKNPDKYLNKIVKYQFFGKGMKDKTRFNSFISFRDPIDMS